MFYAFVITALSAAVQLFCKHKASLQSAESQGESLIKKQNTHCSINPDIDRVKSKTTEMCLLV